MSGLSDLYEQIVLKHLFCVSIANTEMVRSSAIYVSLHTSDPTDTETPYTEVVGGSYERKLIQFSLPSTGQNWISNSNQVVFTLMPLCTVTHMAFWDEFGVMMASGAIVTLDATPIVSGVELLPGDTLTFDIGDITLSIE